MSSNTTARAVAAHIRPDPVHRWELPGLTRDEMDRGLDRPTGRDVQAEVEAEWAATSYAQDEAAEADPPDRSAVSSFDPDDENDPGTNYDFPPATPGGIQL